MTISGPDTTAATTAIAALQSAIETHATKGGPHEKNLYAGEALLPLIISSNGLAVTLGRALYTEQIAAAEIRCETSLPGRSGRVSSLC